MSEFVCNCFEVTEDDIRQAIRQGRLTCVDDVTAATEAGSGCGGCCERIQEILDDELKNAEAAVPGE